MLIEVLFLFAGQSRFASDSSFGQIYVRLLIYREDAFYGNKEIQKYEGL